jgi:muramoyltetrapeptide carboxypeptidase LdcA involved in peptidoglycan recycling
MIKPQKLQPGDKVAIVSLSRGILGEPSAAHQLPLAEARLKELGLTYEYMPHAKKGIEYVKNHPEARASDLKLAFSDGSIKGIICAIGGDDTYRTIPFLLDDPEFAELVQNNPKVFLGFSDTTNNHLLFYKLGLQTYYGQALLTDIGEFANDMLPYSKEWLGELLAPGPSKEITSSPTWYDERESFGPEQIGTNKVAHDEAFGFEVLRGSGVVEGELLGGCIESLYDNLSGERHADEKTVIKKYGIFPSADQWSGKIFFAETSEEKPEPEKLRKMLETLDEAGVLSAVRAILVGKPQNEVYYQEYKSIWLEATSKYDTPILYNINIGHAAPRCILPYGGKVTVDFDQARLFLNEPLVAS